MAHGQCYGSFWSTQYIALVGLSTFYVLLIQGVRNAAPSLNDMEAFLNVDDCLAKARHCQDHLATLPPPGSQAARHHNLLAHLRSKAEKSLFKRRNINQVPKEIPGENAKDVNSATKSALQHQNDIDKTKSTTDSTNLNFMPSRSGEVDSVVGAASFPSIFDQSMGSVQEVNDYSTFSMMLTPNSNSDSGFQYMLDYGWESLDTVGAGSMNGPDIFGYGMSQ